MVTANTIALTIFFIVPTSVVVSFPLQRSSVVGVIPALGDFKEIGGRARASGNEAFETDSKDAGRSVAGFRESTSAPATPEDDRDVCARAGRRAIAWDLPAWRRSIVESCFDAELLCIFAVPGFALLALEFTGLTSA